MHPIDPDERSKINQLINESKQGQHKVEWLYGGNKIDKEAYLLGKPIDKLLTENEKEKEATAAAASYIPSTVDLANKIREDPLFEIKKQEFEAKKRLIENPLKIKQLKELLSKTSSKSKKYDYNDSDSSDSDRKQKKQKKKKNQNYNRSNSRSRSRSRSRDKDAKKYKKSSTSRSRSNEKQLSRRRDNDDGYYGYRKRSKSPADTSSRSHHHHESSKLEEINRYKKRYDDLKNLRDNTTTKTTDRKKQHTHTTSDYHRTSTSSSSSRIDEVKKLSDAEKALKLQQMTENAKWRNEIRNKNVKKYRDDDKKEELDDRNKNDPEASEVFNSMMRGAYSSAEDRIKRNVKNIQRNENAYDRNFARK